MDRSETVVLKTVATNGIHHVTAGYTNQVSRTGATAQIRKAVKQQHHDKVHNPQGMSLIAANVHNGNTITKRYFISMPINRF